MGPNHALIDFMKQIRQNRKNNIFQLPNGRWAVDGHIGNFSTREEALAFAKECHNASFLFVK